MSSFVLYQLHLWFAFFFCFRWTNTSFLCPVAQSFIVHRSLSVRFPTFFGHVFSVSLIAFISFYLQYSMESSSFCLSMFILYSHFVSAKRNLFPRLGESQRFGLKHHDQGYIIYIYIIILYIIYIYF